MPNNRVTEAEISEGVLKVLAAKHDGDATLGHIKRRIPSFVNLSEEDHAISTTRPNEELWEQIVRNIVSHKDTEGNYIREGYLTAPSKGRLRITDAGRKRVS